MDKLINKYSKDKNLNEIKLHLGCGHRKFSNWINIDNYEFEQGDTSRKCCNADLMLDITKLNEYVEENTVSEIMLVHVLEHFTRWIAIDLFKIFYSVLKKDGLLIMEHPDLDGCIDLYKKSNRTLSTPIGEINLGKTALFGNQWSGLEYETHRYIWDKPEIRIELEKVGFQIVELHNKTKYHVPGRDMRVIALKK